MKIIAVRKNKTDGGDYPEGAILELEEHLAQAYILTGSFVKYEPAPLKQKSKAVKRK